MIKKILFTLAICFILPLQLSAETKEENAKRAKEILEKANKAMTTVKDVTTTTSKIMPGDLVQTMIQYWKNNSDGTIFTRTESYLNRKNKKRKISSLFINNDKGMFHIMGNTAIKMAYVSNMNKSVMKHVNKSNMGKLNKDNIGGNISVKDGKLNEINCYIITVKKSKEEIDFMLNIMTKSMPQLGNIDDFKKNIPIISQYYISKENNYIYSTSQFSKNGKKISDQTYDSIIINSGLEDDLFTISDEMKIYEAKTMTDYGNIVLENLKNKRGKK